MTSTICDDTTTTTTTTTTTIPCCRYPSLNEKELDQLRSLFLFHNLEQIKQQQQRSIHLRKKSSSNSLTNFPLSNNDNDDHDCTLDQFVTTILKDGSYNVSPKTTTTIETETTTATPETSTIETTTNSEKSNKTNHEEDDDWKFFQSFDDESVKDLDRIFYNTVKYCRTSHHYLCQKQQATNNPLPINTCNSSSSSTQKKDDDDDKDNEYNVGETVHHNNNESNKNNNNNNNMENQTIFLDACVTLLGGQTTIPTSEIIINHHHHHSQQHEQYHQQLYYDDHNNSNSNKSNNNNNHHHYTKLPILDMIFQAAAGVVVIDDTVHDDDDVEIHDKESYVDSVRLIQLVYRLLKMSMEISYYGNNHKINNNNKDSLQQRLELPTNVPLSWIRSMQLKVKNNNRKMDPSSSSMLLISHSEWILWVQSTIPNLCRTLQIIYHTILFSFFYDPDSGGGGLCCGRRRRLDCIFYMTPHMEHTLRYLQFDTKKMKVHTTTTILHRYQNPIRTTGSTSSNYFSLFCLQFQCMNLQDPVEILYNSTEHGLHFSTFSHTLLKYYGPTLLIMETTTTTNDKNHVILGYYSEIPWKTSPEWFTGSGTSFLFQLYPTWCVYHPQQHTSTSTNGHHPTNGTSSSSTSSTTSSNHTYGSIRRKQYHQYLYDPVSYRKGTNMIGLGVGGIDSSTPRFFLNKSFEHCMASSFDTMFECGPLLSSSDNDDNNHHNYTFDIDTIEVWAFNKQQQNHYNHNNTSNKMMNQNNQNKSNNNNNIDTHKNSIKKGQQNYAMRERVRISCATVDKVQFLDDFTSGMFLNNVFDHRQEAIGNVTFDTKSSAGTE